MKNKLITSTAVLVLLAVLGHAGAKPLWAQIRAAIVRNVDEPGRSPYQSAAINGPLTPFQCIAEFAPVPPNKRLVVRHVSGAVAVDAAVSGVFVVLEAPNLLVNVPRAFFSATHAGAVLWTANQEMTLFVEAGGVPRLRFDLSGTARCSASATLSGYLVDLTQ